MVHRFFFFRRFVFMMLAAALLFGGARALFGAGYRQGFVQGSMMAAGDGQAVTVAPEAAFRTMTHWGLGPLGAMFCGLPLALLGLGGLAFIFATGARRPSPFGRGMGRGPRHGPPGWKHAHGPGRRPTDDIGPEKQPNDFV